MTTPLISIIVLSWNARAMTQRCLQQLLKILPDEKISCEIIVVDNGSVDGSREMIMDLAARYPGIKPIMNAENLLYAAANNQGLKNAHGKFLLLLNNDVLLPTGALSAMMHFLIDHQNYGGATLRLCNPDGSTQYYMHRRFPRPWVLGLALMHKRFRWFRPAAVADYLYLDRDFLTAFDVEQAAGACLMLRRSAIIAIGGLFDAVRFPLYYNDVDLCRRLAQAHLSIRCLPTPCAVHEKGASVRRLSMRKNLQFYLPAVWHYFTKHGAKF